MNQKIYSVKNRLEVQHLKMFQTVCNRLLLFPLIIFMMISCRTGESASQNAEYDITSTNNISRVRLSKMGSDENRVEIIIRGRSQMTSSGPSDVILQGSSGVQENSSFRGYEEVSFPFNGSVGFDYSKQQNDVVGSAASNVESLATSVRASVSFVIKEPGQWRVNIYY